MKSNVALIGFMGTGKTAVGEVLAQRLGKDFVELDALIETKAGKAIAEIFKQEGEAAFRELEIAVVKKVAGKKNSVIACGGGVVLHKINIDRLQENAVIVYLTASPSVILKRTANDGGMRPLLNVNDKEKEIRKLLRLRRPMYEQAADITVNTSRLGINGIVEKTAGELEKYEGFR